MGDNESGIYESVADYGNIYEDVRDENFYETVPGQPAPKRLNLN